MKLPSIVSSRDMPAANRTGRVRIAYQGSPLAAPVPARTRKATSVAVALLIGTVELVGLLGQEFNLGGGFWDWVERLNINTLGFLIVGLFVGTWLVAVGIWRAFQMEHRYRPAASITDPLPEAAEYALPELAE